MDAAQDSFISSTYWTDRMGPAASIATINKLLKHDVPTHLCKIGESISKGWAELAEKHGLDVEIMGIPPLTTFAFHHEEKQAMHTLFTQEMLDRGLLAAKSVYASYAHTKEHVTEYLENADEAFATIKKAVESKNIRKLLRGPVAESSFKRLA
jgi:glutamate-1-semialdehyde aminotransferase